MTAGCSGAVDGPEPAGFTSANDRIDAYVRSLGKLPESPSVVVQSGPGATQAQGDYSCSSENFKETRQYDKIVAFAANSESLQKDYGAYGHKLKKHFNPNQR